VRCADVQDAIAEPTPEVLEQIRVIRSRARLYEQRAERPRPRRGGEAAGNRSELG
jgi:hypothetical protein